MQSQSHQQLIDWFLKHDFIITSIWLSELENQANHSKQIILS